MQYFIDDFLVETVTKTTNKEYTLFKILYLKKDQNYYNVLENIFVFIDLVEILKAFSGNRLNTQKEYRIANNFIAKTTQKDGNMYLKLHFKKNDIYLDKFECSSLAAKFSKILQRCEAWQG